MSHPCPSSEPTQQSKFINKGQRQIFNTVPVALPLLNIICSFNPNTHCCTLPGQSPTSPVVPLRLTSLCNLKYSPCRTARATACFYQAEMSKGCIKFTFTPFKHLRSSEIEPALRSVTAIGCSSFLVIRIQVRLGSEPINAGDPFQ